MTIDPQSFALGAFVALCLVAAITGMYLLASHFIGRKGPPVVL